MATIKLYDFLRAVEEIPKLTVLAPLQGLKITGSVPTLLSDERLQKHYTDPVTEFDWKLGHLHITIISEFTSHLTIDDLKGGTSFLADDGIPVYIRSHELTEDKLECFLVNARRQIVVNVNAEYTTIEELEKHTDLYIDDYLTWKG